MTPDMIVILFMVGAFITLVIYFYFLLSRKGGKTVEDTSVPVVAPTASSGAHTHTFTLVLDYVKFMLDDLRKRGFDYPHIVLFTDMSGRVCKGPAVGGLDKILFHFDDIDGIGTDYLRWQWDVRYG